MDPATSYVSFRFTGQAPVRAASIRGLQVHCWKCGWGLASLRPRAAPTFEASERPNAISESHVIVGPEEGAADEVSFPSGWGVADDGSWKVVGDGAERVKHGRRPRFSQPHVMPDQTRRHFDSVRPVGAPIVAECPRCGMRQRIER